MWKKNKKKNSSESLSLMYSKLGRVMGGRCTQTSHHLRQKQWLMWRPAVINLSGVVRAINGHSTTNGRAMPRLMRPSTFSSVLSATASGAHPHPPTHALHRTVMSPGLMHRTTQLERKKKCFTSLSSQGICMHWRVHCVGVDPEEQAWPTPHLYCVVLCACVWCNSKKPNRADSSSQKPSDLWPDGLV